MKEATCSWKRCFFHAGFGECSNKLLLVDINDEAITSHDEIWDLSQDLK